jgi:hypothetical protein
MHEVLYRNTHQSKISVYLANALVPTDKQVEIPDSAATQRSTNSP